MKGLESFLSAPYVWIYIGVVLVWIEKASPRYFYIFFSIGTVFTSLASILFQPSIPVQVIVFFTCSILSLIYLRPRILKWSIGRTTSDPDWRKKYMHIGISAIATTDFLPGQVGEVKFENHIKEVVSKDKIKKGDVVKLVKTDQNHPVVKFVERF
jgi:inner membrane protein